MSYVLVLLLSDWSVSIGTGGPAGSKKSQMRMVSS